MPEELRTEPGEVHPAFWTNTVKEAFKNDPLRIVIELIKNAADSYTRAEKRGSIKPPFNIVVTFYCKKNNPPIIEVLDYAEGMDSKKLKEALKYGTQTSRGEDIEAVTSAEKGIGLKDAMMALEDNWLITINENLINERKKHKDFSTGFGREDAIVTKGDREKLQIPKNGTLIKGRLPDYFKTRKFGTICEYLQKHYLIRKILQEDKYRIFIIDGFDKENEEELKYSPPEIDKEILKETINIPYEGENYKIHLSIYKSKDELSIGKPCGESGLLFFYGKYSVLDLTFCRFDRDASFSKFFGEVRMEIEKIIRDPYEAPIVEEKRRGLDNEHPFNKKVFLEIEKRLKNIQEQQESSKYSLDDKAKKEIIKEINKIYNDIKGRGPPPEPPIKPQTFAFYPVYVSIKEYEPKRVFLVINSSIIDNEFEIKLQSTNPDIILKSSRIKIDKEKVNEDFIIKQLEIYSEKATSRGEIRAKSNDSEEDEYEKMGVEVLENPIFSPNDGFAFVPDNTTIVDDGEKKIELYINKNLITGSEEIKIYSESPILCPGKWILPRADNLENRIIKNVVRLEIPIKVKGRGFIGNKSRMTAIFRNKIANINITVVPQPSITGLFRDIILSSKDTKRISGFIKEEGFLEIYYKHPLIKKYMKKNFIQRADFLIFIADTVTREVIKTFVSMGIDESSSRFPIFNIDRPEPEIDYYVTQGYYEYGIKLHEMFMKLARTFKSK